MRKHVRLLCIAAMVAGLGFGVTGCGKREEVKPSQHYGHSLSQESKEYAWKCIDKSVDTQLKKEGERLPSMHRIEEVCWNEAYNRDELIKYQRKRQGL